MGIAREEKEVEVRVRGYECHLLTQWKIKRYWEKLTEKDKRFK